VDLHGPKGLGLLRVERCLIDEHDGDIVAHRVQAPALTTFQRVVLFSQPFLAHGADQDLEKAFVDHFGNSTPNGVVYQFRAGFPAIGRSLLRVGAAQPMQ
jgi:hypothetical protein